MFTKTQSAIVLFLVSRALSEISAGQTAIGLKEAIAGSDYQYQIKVKGGMKPLTFSQMPDHPLPEGLSVDTSTGLITGNVKESRSDAYLFGVVVTDSSDPPQKFAQTFSLKVNPAPLQIVDDTNPSRSGAQESGTSKPEAPILQGAILASDQVIKGSISNSATKVEVLYGGKIFILNQEQIAAQKHPGHFELKIEDSSPLIAGEEVTARQTVSSLVSDFSQGVTVQPVWRHGELANAIVGFEQAGASAAQSSQNFFFNFYISRPLPFDFLKRHRDDDVAEQRLSAGDDSWNPPLRWWGNVRVASYPQQINTPVAAFASSLAANIGQLKVNELAQSAEFVTGLEFPVFRFSARPFFGRSEDIRQRFSLAFFAGGGATGPLDPKSSLSIFQVPAQNSPQFAAFIKQYRQATSSQYIGFVSPDRDRFFRTYFGGFRLTTEYLSAGNRTPLNASPALVSFSLGQNEIVTGGKLSGIVGRIEAFYPLPIGTRSRLSGIYLFGTAMMRMSGAKDFTPFILAPAPATVHGYDPSVAIIAIRGTRDIYRIGVGIDLVSAIHTWTTKPSSDTGANSNPVTPAKPATTTATTSTPAAGASSPPPQ